MQEAKGARVKDLGGQEAKGQVVKYACASVKVGNVMDHDTLTETQRGKMMGQDDAKAIHVGHQKLTLWITFML
jgi:hypothetical protein